MLHLKTRKAAIGLAALLLCAWTSFASAGDPAMKIVVPCGTGSGGGGNSLQAFTDTWKMKGVTGVSTCVARTADRVLFCIENFKAAGDILHTKAADFEKQPASGSARLTDVLQAMPKDKALFMEIASEDSKYDYQMIPSLKKAFDECTVDKTRIYVVSPYQWVLRDVRKMIPEIRTVLLAELVDKPGEKQPNLTFRALEAKLRTNDFAFGAVILTKKNWSPGGAAALAKNGYGLCIWKFPAELTSYAAAIGAAIVRTEAPETFLKAAEKAGSAELPAAAEYVPESWNKPFPAPHPGIPERNPHPYRNIDWGNIKQIHTTSHAHNPGGSGLKEWLARTPNRMEFVTLSNYYPSAPTYPLKKMTGNYYRLHHDFPAMKNGKLTNGPFDWNKIISEWKDSLSESAKKELPFKEGPSPFIPSELPPGIPEAPNAEHHHFTDSARHICAVGSFFATGNFDQGNRFKLRDHGYGTGTARPWKEAFSQALEQLQFKDGGGITINHPHYPLYSSAKPSKLLEMLDFDPRVLGIEVFNLNCVEDNSGTGWADDLWDGILGTGRQCFGFFVPDHCNWRGGHNVLLVPALSAEECLRAYRLGNFYGAVWGQSVRFTKIAFDGKTFEIAVDRPSEILFISKKGIVKRAKGTNADFQLEAGSAKDHVFLRAVAKDEIGEQIFTQPFILEKSEKKKAENTQKSGN